MEIGEVRIRELDGKPVWMKKLGEDFYLMNGAYCAGDGTLDMESSDVIREYLEWLTGDVIPYRGADNGYTITFTKLASGKYCVNQFRLSMYEEAVSAEHCEAALREYKAWATVKGR